jgi:predicted transcriptional regulator
MVLPLNHSSSNQQPIREIQKEQVKALQLIREIQKEQVEALQLIREIQKEQVEALQLIREIQKEQVEARREAEAEKLSQAKIEAEKCKRLIAIVLKHAESKGISPSDLPNLKRKSYNELCAYINKYWPELSNRI